MLRYNRYYKMFGLKKLGDLSKVHALSGLAELPMGSVLHLGKDYLKDPSPDNVTIPSHSTFDKYSEGRKVIIKFNLHSDLDGNHSLEPDDRIVERTGEIKSSIRKYRTTDIRIAESHLDFSDQYATYFNVHAYTPMFSVTVRGYLERYRVITQFLDHVIKNVESDTRIHFILFPLNEITYTFESFKKSYKDHTVTALLEKEDPTYLLLVHLLGFIFSEETKSIFNKMSPSAQSRLNLVFCNEETDKCIHLRLDILRAMAVKKPTVGRIVFASLKFISAKPIIETVADDGADAKLVVPVQSIGSETPVNVTAVNVSIPVEEKMALRKQMEDKATESSIDMIANIPDMPEFEKKTIITQIKKEDSVVVGNTTIKQIRTAVTPPTDVDVRSIMGDTPAKDMAVSKGANFHKTYIRQHLKKDMVGVLTSYKSVGLTLMNIEEKEEIDDVNRIVRYKAKFVDKDGTETTIPFSFPKLDDDGTFMANGSLKRISIQRANLPICKVSPTRVTLNSNVNKALVDMVESKSHSLLNLVIKSINSSELGMRVIYGGSLDRNICLPREYASICSTITVISGLGVELTYNYKHRFEDLSPIKAEEMQKLEKVNKCIYMGSIDKKPCFMDGEGFLNYGENRLRLLDVLSMRLTDITIKPYSEWVNVTLTNQALPMAFVLSCQYGFETCMKRLGVKYEKIPKGSKLAVRSTDILIKLYDVTVVIRSPTTAERMIFSGMNYFNLTEVESNALESKDVYYTILHDKGISISYVSTISNFFDLFVDHMTKNILIEMGEPTDFRGLLLRSVALLTTSDYKEASSATMYRYRSYEMLNASLARSMARAIMTHRNQSKGHKKKVSLSEFEVYSNFVNDALVYNVDQVNPIGELKAKLRFSHMGNGGRTAQAITTADRRFPQDGVGTMSEQSPVSGNVGIEGVLPLSPTLYSAYGLPDTSEAITSISQVVSPIALLMPGALIDDTKRLMMTAQQTSQFLPIEGKQQARLRTSFERVIAHMIGMPFVYTAEQDGTITKIDEEARLLCVTYKDGSKVAVDFGSRYSRHSSASFVIDHKLVVRPGLKEKSTIKRGDIVIYNENFFSIDEHTNQADMYLGYFTNVALVDKDKTLDDACVISKKLSENLTIVPVNPIEVFLPKDSFVHMFCEIGKKVKKSDPLIIFDEIDITEKVGDAISIEALKELNKSIPKCKYNGTIVNIEVFHRCPISELSPSLKKLAKHATGIKSKRAELAEGTSNASEFLPYAPLMSDKIRGTMIDMDTVMLKFYVQSRYSMGSSDKMVYGNQLKSVAAGIMGGKVETYENKKEIDALMSASSVGDRMVTSVLYAMSMETLLEAAEQKVLDIFFK